jgi:hypothetical protein
LIASFRDQNAELECSQMLFEGQKLKKSPWRTQLRLHDVPEVKDCLDFAPFDTDKNWFMSRIKSHIKDKDLLHGYVVETSFMPRAAWIASKPDVTNRLCSSI